MSTAVRDAVKILAGFSLQRVALGTFVLCSGLLVGCDEQEYSHVSFDAVTSPPLRANVTSDKITLPEGIALQVLARPIARGYDYERDVRLSLISEDDEVFTVFPTAASDRFVLVGVSPGSTCVEIRVNGAREDCIRVSVTAQK